MSDTPVLECRGLCRSYRDGELSVDVLRDVNFELPAAAKVAIVGASGSGKSTLLNLLGGLDLPTSGQVLMSGRDLAVLDEEARCELRNRELGFVYQFHHLLPEFSALENIAMPLLIRRETFASARQLAQEWLERVGLAARAEHKPGELSGGERQRVALARALVTRPDCLLADEPTGNLDQQTAAQMLELMMNLNRELETALVVVTHDLDIAARMQHQWRMQDGLLAPEA